MTRSENRASEKTNRDFAFDMTTKRDLEEQVATLTEELKRLQEDTPRVTLRSKPPALKLEDVATDKQFEAFNTWWTLVTRWRKRLATNANFKDDLFILDVLDLTHSCPRLTTAINVLELSQKMPTNLDQLKKLIIDTYRLKAAGYTAYLEFNKLRQQKLTPRELLLKLEQLAAQTNADPESPNVSHEVLVNTFRSALWPDVQREIESICLRDKLDGRAVRDLTQIDTLLELAEFVYDQLKRRQEDSRRLREQKEKLKNNDQLKVNNVQILQRRPRWAELPEETKNNIREFQKTHKPPFAAAQLTAAKQLGVCTKCGLYGHFAAKCRVDIAKKAINNLTVPVVSPPSEDQQSKQGKGSGC